jgi:cytosine/adenosine deaminase-related metal-dependent hydrolase
MRLLIEGKNCAVAVTDGCIDDLSGRFDHVIRIPDGEIRPGLINAHDHLHRNHYGRLGVPPYANAYQWAADIQSRFGDLIAEGRRMPRRQALLRGAWKNLLSGVTYVVHHDFWEPDFELDFPLSVIPIVTADSLGMTEHLRPPEDSPFALHVAEGIDAVAADEIEALEQSDLLNQRLIAVHVVGPSPNGVAQIRARGCAIAWCPSSNQFLFGRTAPASLLAEGIEVLLGTDSLLTGAGDLLDEIRIARSLGFISDARLQDAVGATAARRLGLPLPGLQIGAQANFAVFRRPVLEATTRDVALVAAAGALRVLDPTLIPVRLSQGQIIEYRGVRRWISELDPF